MSFHLHRHKGSASCLHHLRLQPILVSDLRRSHLRALASDLPPIQARESCLPMPMRQVLVSCHLMPKLHVPASCHLMPMRLVREFCRLQPMRSGRGYGRRHKGLVSCLLRTDCPLRHCRRDWELRHRSSGVRRSQRPCCSHQERRIRPCLILPGPEQKSCLFVDCNVSLLPRCTCHGTPTLSSSAMLGPKSTPYYWLPSPHAPFRLGHP